MSEHEIYQNILGPVYERTKSMAVAPDEVDEMEWFCKCADTPVQHEMHTREAGGLVDEVMYVLEHGYQALLDMEMEAAYDRYYNYN
jgi:hypothetical protein